MMAFRPKVIIRQAENYESEFISTIIQEGMEELGVTSKIKGRITIKPNVVMAHHRVAPSAFTRAEFLEGLLEALRRIGGDDLRISLTEKCGAGLPTTRMFRRAGYYQLKKKYPLRLVAIEEAQKKTIHLEKGLVHRCLRTAKEIVERDCLIYAPKLKSNVLSHGLTASLKLNVGLLCDRQRMWNHNYNLDEKIVDLLETGYPDFIATDAIEIACGGNQLTQLGYHLGAIILSANPLAHDVVCSHIFHLDPHQIGHLVAAARRGYGSLNLEDIEISGDLSLEELQQRTANLTTGFIRLEKAHPRIKVVNGEPYCTGGCQGVFLDWLYMIKDRKPDLWKEMPEWTVVIGHYKGDIEARRLLLLGRCTKVEGKIRARLKRRIGGCPPTHKDLVLWLFLKAGIMNPLFRPDLIIDAYFFLGLSWLKRVLTGRL